MITTKLNTETTEITFETIKLSINNTIKLSINNKLNVDFKVLSFINTIVTEIVSDGDYEYGDIIIIIDNCSYQYIDTDTLSLI